MVNGYVTLDLASNKIYNESLGAIKSGKPVMVVDAPNVYFADTIAISGDDVVITKGGKTITINDANAVSSEGEIQPSHLYMYVGDSSDLSFQGESVSNSNYYKFVTTLDNLKKLSDLPIGNYQVVTGTIINGESNEIQIQSIKVLENELMFYLCDDDTAIFTISVDNSLQKIKLF